MLQRLRRKSPTGPGKAFRIQHVVNGGGWHVVYQTDKGVNETKPVMLFAMASSKDGGGSHIVVPYVNMGNGKVAVFDPAQVIEYFYHPESLMREGTEVTITPNKG